MSRLLNFGALADTPRRVPGILDEGHDGDTFWAWLDLGWGDIRRVEIRLEGIDTPELTPRLDVPGRLFEKAEAAAAADFTTAWLARGPFMVTSLAIDGNGRFGRSLATVDRDGQSLVDALMWTNRFAVHYDPAHGVTTRWRDVYGRPA